MSKGLLDATHRAWRLAVDYLNDREQSRTQVNEFMEMGREEVINILANAGVTTDEFVESMRQPFASEDLLASAMDTLGIDLKAVEKEDPSWARDARRICMLCDHRFRCYREFATLSFAENHRDFCPNKERWPKAARTKGLLQ